MANHKPSIVAAGGVLWRPSKKHGVKVALIHRPEYDDWSLPKGKAEPGESIVLTAAREIWEETGFRVALGRRLSTVDYPLGSKQKTVRYFAAQALSGSFAPNREVDQLIWCSVAKAHEKLSHHRDRTVLDSFAALPAHLSTVIVVRHAVAGHREDFLGDDNDRPLTAKGWRQAAALASQLAVFAPQSVGAAPLLRCEQTIAPLASHLRMTVSSLPTLSEVAYAQDAASARRTVVNAATSAAAVGSAVMCSQGGVIPALIRHFAGRSHLDVPTFATPKGAFWVLSFAGKQLKQVDRYIPAR